MSRFMASITETPPLTRGRLKGLREILTNERNTPAYAGKTYNEWFRDENLRNTPAYAGKT